MKANKITIKIKHLTDKVYDVEIEEGASILDLKATLSEITGVPTTDQKLIFKGNHFFSFSFYSIFSGKMLKDSDILKALGVENGSALHMVQTKATPGMTGTTSQPSTTQSTTGTSGTGNFGIPTNMSSGGGGLLNQFGFGISCEN